MLSIKNYIEEWKSDRANRNWGEMVEEKKVVRCKVCGKWIDAYWHIDCFSTVSKKARFNRMEYCGPHLPDNLW